MRIIRREALKEKLDRGDPFNRYMTLDRHAYDQSHVYELAGSMNHKIGVRPER